MVAQHAALLRFSVETGAQGAPAFLPRSDVVFYWGRVAFTWLVAAWCAIRIFPGAFSEDTESAPGFCHCQCWRVCRLVFATTRRSSWTPPAIFVVPLPLCVSTRTVATHIEMVRRFCWLHAAQSSRNPACGPSRPAGSQSNQSPGVPISPLCA